MNSRFAQSDELIRVCVQYYKFKSGGRDPTFLDPASPGGGFSHKHHSAAASAAIVSDSKRVFALPEQTYGMANLQIDEAWRAKLAKVPDVLELCGIDLRLAKTHRELAKKLAKDHKELKYPDNVVEALVDIVTTRPSGVYVSESVTVLVYALTQHTVAVRKRLTSSTAAGDSKQLSVQAKIQLITRNLEEILLPELIEPVLQERDMKIYWGTAPTGPPHIGYFVPMSKIADFLRADCHVTILIADLHAHLDALKTPWNKLQYRSAYYEAVIKSMLKSIGVPIARLNFVRGSSFQLDSNYTRDMYRISSFTGTSVATKAAADVVKLSENPQLSCLLYPILQSLDEEYLGVDAQFGGLDQRKILVFAQDCLPRLGYKKRIHLMNPMVPGLNGGKMSASEANSKIDLLDSAEAVEAKVSKAKCIPGVVPENGVLAFCKYVITPLLKEKGEPFLVSRDAANGGDVQFDSYDAIEQAYAAEKLHPGDLKPAVAKYINQLLEPIRKEFDNDVMRKLVHDAYAESEEDKEKVVEEKKESKVSLRSKRKAADGDDVSFVELKVGQVQTVAAHPSNDASYVLTVDVGGPAPRTIVSGIAKFIPAADLANKRVVVFTNTQPSKFQGVASEGMVLAAASEDGKQVELLVPPAASKVGDRVLFEGYEQPEEYPMFNPKKKVFDKYSVDMATDAAGVAKYQDAALHTADGPVTVAQLKSCKIK